MVKTLCFKTTISTDKETRFKGLKEDNDSLTIYLMSKSGKKKGDSNHSDQIIKVMMTAMTIFVFESG